VSNALPRHSAPAAFPGSLRARRRSCPRAVWLPILALLLTCLPSCAGAQAGSARADEPPCETPDLPAGAAADVVVPVLDATSVSAWSAYLSPTADELSWEAVDWLPTYSEGVAAAQSQRRPLLLWAMNGHPLGCT
jgi:hypothetical protein